MYVLRSLRGEHSFPRTPAQRRRGASNKTCAVGLAGGTNTNGWGRGDTLLLCSPELCILTWQQKKSSWSRWCLWRVLEPFHLAVKIRESWRGSLLLKKISNPPPPPHEPFLVRLRHVAVDVEISCCGRQFHLGKGRSEMRREGKANTGKALVSKKQKTGK